MLLDNKQLLYDNYCKEYKTCNYINEVNDQINN